MMLTSSGVILAAFLLLQTVASASVAATYRAVLAGVATGQQTSDAPGTAVRPLDGRRIVINITYTSDDLIDLRFGVGGVSGYMRYPKDAANWIAVPEPGETSHVSIYGSRYVQGKGGLLSADLGLWIDISKAERDGGRITFPYPEWAAGWLTWAAVRAGAGPGLSPETRTTEVGFLLSAITISELRPKPVALAAAPTAPSPVPLPAAGWVMLASLTGLAALGRRRATRTSLQA